MDAQAKLFTPVQIGPITLKHRVVMPALSRLRAQWPSGVPSALMLEYYTQRASDGGLILTEATAIAPSGRGYRGAPGIYTDEQVMGWKRITDAVHAKGGCMFAQLWHAGRTTHVAITGEQPVSASVDPTYWADPSIRVVTPDGFAQPSPHRALETAEIAEIVAQYRAAAANAKRAGFDGVEVMAANGHLIDQFLQDNSNTRTDRYGGSIENRTRLLIEIVEALLAVWGAVRIGVRIAPSGTFNGMADSDPRTLFRHVTKHLDKFGLAYLHIIEPRIKGGELIAEGQGAVAAQELSKLFHGPVIAAGGFQPDTAEATIAHGDASLIAFGRNFIANPDLPLRIKLGLPLNPYDRSTFYAFDGRGYTDYPAYNAPATKEEPMYYEVITQCVQSLKNAETWLDKAERYAAAKKFEIGVLLNGRLAPDMKPLIYQVQSACDYVKAAAAWLSGQRPPQHEDNERTLDELRARIRKTVAFAEGVKEGQYEGASERNVSLSWAPGKVIGGEDYLLQMTIPNTFFHLAMSYAILRHQGVDVGKMDFLGPINLVESRPRPAPSRLEPTL
jgi:N-ethylmaleimide reductase